jgi:hypothetical protein
VTRAPLIGVPDIASVIDPVTIAERQPLGCQEKDSVYGSHLARRPSSHVRVMTADKSASGSPRSWPTIHSTPERGRRSQVTEPKARSYQFIRRATNITNARSASSAIDFATSA